MIKTTCKIDGMMCGMCEAHINDIIRKNLEVDKVSSSHSKGETVIYSKNEPDAEVLKRAISDAGYELIGQSSEEVKKSSLFERIFKREKA